MNPMLNTFIEYLQNQIGQPYLWGGQHTKLTPETYEAIIHKREDGRGWYVDGQSVADAAIQFCKEKFDAGATELFAYDCSGLGMYWIQNIKHIWTDRTADRMMTGCLDCTTTGEPKRGWWVFRTDKTGKATHIGYMVSDTELIEAKGCRWGVVQTKWKKSAWSIWGIPSIFYDEIVTPEPPKPVPPEPDPPEPDPPELKWYVEVLGKSVRVRSKGSVLGKTLFIAHKGNRFELIGTAPSGWYQIRTEYPEAYITNKPKYTKVVEL